MIRFRNYTDRTSPVFSSSSDLLCFFPTKNVNRFLVRNVPEIRARGISETSGIRFHPCRAGYSRDRGKPVHVNCNIGSKQLVLPTIVLHKKTETIAIISIVIC
jgi:hypothetical protein